MKIDIVFPDRNESEFIKMAVRLGWEGLCFCYPNKMTAKHTCAMSSTIPLFSASLTDRSGGILIAESKGDDRSLIERGEIKVLYNLESKQKQDFMHQRGSGLNHILCNLMKKNDVALGFSFFSLVNADSLRRGQIVGKMQQNFRLAAKYGTPTIIASFVHDPMQMRSPHDLHALFLSLGMSTGLASSSFDTLERIALRRR